eukprot:TRINITY_DN3745_c0_g1_i1.p1 TRINITY_DN3745_c0_g1~~TRINITY_DN3745_c0_g1_i1.p1  ORF type:complete len:155 (-),score=22.72 TRINITY_DN3745_c0_g1_i1:618-1082(-)
MMIILICRMLTTQRIKSRTGVSEKYDVYFCKFDRKREEKNLLKAVKSFKMRNKREPTNLEVMRLKGFLATNFEQTSLVQFKLSVVSDSDDDDKEEQKEEVVSEKQQKIKTTPSKVLVTPVKKKKSAARYNVYFDDKNNDKNEKSAIKWVERFNN